MPGLYFDTFIIGHIWQYVKYIKCINIAKRIAKFHDKLCVLHKNVKTQQQQNKKANIKNIARGGNWTRDLSHPSRVRYLYTRESTEYVN